MMKNKVFYRELQQMSIIVNLFSVYKTTRITLSPFLLTSVYYGKQQQKGLISWQLS